jgi:hypothetical protein
MEESGEAEHRCPNCGALAVAGAEWCWRCFQRLAALEPPPEAEAEAEAPGTEQGLEPGVPARPDLGDDPDAPHPRAPAKVLAWPCAACGHENGIELEVCERCGTSFAALMKSDEKPPNVPPQLAFRRSLIYPGLGHAMVGRSLDGIARGALFAMLLMMMIIFLLSGVSGTLGWVVLALFVAMCLVVYLETAWEAYRLASGDPPLITSRMLLWVATGVILGSSAIFAYSLATAAKR